MITEFFVSDVIQDESLPTRKTKIRIGTNGKKFETPLRVGQKSIVSMSPIYEIYNRITKDKLTAMLKDPKIEQDYNRYIKNSEKSNMIELFYLDYNSKLTIPTTKELELYADIQSSHGDVIVVPSWSFAFDHKIGDNLEKYCTLSEIYLKAALDQNNKPVLATIPQSTPNEDLDKMVRFYVNKGIKSFIIDSLGRSSINPSWLKSLYRQIGQQSIAKECFTYSINANRGTSRKNTDYFEAKDFLGFGLGFDVIGDQHRPKYSMPADSGPIPDYNIVNKFDSRNYCYHKVPYSSQAEKESITGESITSQILEMNHIRSVLNDNKTLMNTLDERHISSTTIGHFKEIKQSQDSDRLTTKLDDYF